MHSASLVRSNPFKFPNRLWDPKGVRPLVPAGKRPRSVPLKGPPEASLIHTYCIAA